MAKRRAKTPTTEDYRSLAGAFDALRDPNRVHILALLSDHAPRTVSTIVDTLNTANGGSGITQPTVSHHLRVLGRAGFVQHEKRGQFVWITSRPDELETLSGVLIGLAGDVVPAPTNLVDFTS